MTDETTEDNKFYKALILCLNRLYPTLSIEINDTMSKDRLRELYRKQITASRRYKFVYNINLYEELV